MSTLFFPDKYSCNPQCDTWNIEDPSSSSVALLVALLLALVVALALVLAVALVVAFALALVTHHLHPVWIEDTVHRPAACFALPHAVRRVRQPHAFWNAVLTRHGAGWFDFDNGFATDA